MKQSNIAFFLICDNVNILMNTTFCLISMSCFNLIVYFVIMIILK